MLFIVHVYKFLICVPCQFCCQKIYIHQLRSEHIPGASFYKYLKNSWLGHGSQWFPLYFPVILNQGCLNSSDPPKTACWVGGGGGGSAHKAVKSTLVIKQNTAASRRRRKNCSVIIPWEARQIDTPSTPPTPCLGAHFYAWLKTYFCHPGVCVFLKQLQQWFETFGKLQLTSAIVWTHGYDEYEFPLVFHAANAML